MERIRLDEHALKIQLAEELPQLRPLVVFAGGVAGLADRHTERGRIQRDLGNERPATTGCGLNRASQGLAGTYQLIEIRCASWDLGDRPVTDRLAQRRHVHLVEEVTKRGIRWRPPQLHTQRLGEHGVVANAKALQISQALASTQDPEHGHQQQVPGGKAHAAPHPRAWNRPQVGDQVEIGCSGGAFQHKEGAIPPTSAHSDRPGKRPWDRL
jgi:hypothetical protein